MPTAASVDRSTSNSNCSRECMTDIVTQILDSMVARNPYTLPMATVYQATENSHPAALSTMTLWRTVVTAGPPSLLAIDTTNGTAYFALDISEGNKATDAVLRGRVKVVDQQITELELFINRNRGDHGFSFSAAELPTNYKELMSPPANRTKASRATLEALSEALFATSSNFSVSVSDSCQFTEIGWRVVDPGTYGNGSTTPLGCSWPSDHPTDSNARVGLVIDEELGFVVTSGTVPGTVYPYGNVSAFIPNAMTSAQEAQEVWFEEMKALGTMPLLSPTGATGDTLEVLQYYNDELQAMQINVYLSGPDMTSPWL
ncbi:hypothetical protein M406DRAFT_339010 [Cryphonectria parasitica EP155]|uniref:Uncharacterized protein n=1 Tax=Cryphonectria parasitica (strain ATCC 38755 / EP155) TaxID=660469 RepID=A0A9P4Y252_CRYP1|nr:uncharacterized protein M406DRAFT_339010 [Cryphonectria parasitica EP155]KAF3765592.1 hypothetical protein M406DRAFT_339010 [Cryphonectria parasitica EP155]